MTVAMSANGGVRVRANDQGTPLNITIESGEMRRAPNELADTIVRLCRDAAISAGMSRRAELERAGVSESVIRALRLPEPAPARESGGEDSVSSWLRRG